MVRDILSTSLSNKSSRVRGIRQPPHMVYHLQTRLILFYVIWCGSTVLLFVGSLWAWLIWQNGCIDHVRRRLSTDNSHLSIQTARVFTERIVDLVTPTLCILMIMSSVIMAVIFTHVLAIAFNQYYMDNVNTRFRWFVSGARTLIASLTISSGTIGAIPGIVESALDSTCGLESTVPSIMIGVGSALLQLGCYVEPCFWKDPLPVEQPVSSYSPTERMYFMRQCELE